MDNNGLCHLCISSIISIILKMLLILRAFSPPLIQLTTMKLNYMSTPQDCHKSSCFGATNI